MQDEPSGLAAWTPEQVALGRRWVAIWQRAGTDLERIRRQELRALDTFRALELLCGSSKTIETVCSTRPTSGLVEQQAWFMKAAHRD